MSKKAKKLKAVIASHGMKETFGFRFYQYVDRYVYYSLMTYLYER